MNQLNTLNPVALWSYFEQICRIPRLSKQEAEIRNWLIEFAIKNELDYHVDAAGNLLIVRNPSPGFENRKTVVLQSHLDMVGEKNADHPHNWFTDPILPMIKNGWVTASGTTLGADDGIGIAAQMAILSDKNFRAGKIECLFTVDEETGMTGAKNLTTSFFEGRTLINLDSEDEGILFIGCAGGIDTTGIIRYEPVPVETGMDGALITLTGLTGGHSGDEIHKGLANSIKETARFLRILAGKYEYGLVSLNGGNLRNGIPREAFAKITLMPSDYVPVALELENFLRELRAEYGALEPSIEASIEPGTAEKHKLRSGDRDMLLEMLADCPHGVLAWSKDMDDLVETSTNLAIVRFNGSGEIEIVTTQRSSLETGKKYAASIVENCLHKAGASVKHSEGYPGWKPDLNSEILAITRASYRKLFSREPLVRAIHAGLECGLLYERYPGIDMISFGPTIRGAHTPEERIDIATTVMFYDLLTDVISNVPERK